MKLRPRHIRIWKYYRHGHSSIQSVNNVPINSVSVAWSMVRYHDQYIQCKWNQRKVANLLDNAHLLCVHIDGHEIELKASKRGYGVKWVQWTPFKIFKHESEVLGTVKIKEILNKGDGNALYKLP